MSILDMQILKVETDPILENLHFSEMTDEDDTRLDFFVLFNGNNCGFAFNSRKGYYFPYTMTLYLCLMTKVFLAFLKSLNM